MSDTNDRPEGMVEMSLGTVTGEELLLAGYEALRNSLAAAIAQIVTTDVAQAKALYAQITHDVDIERARFILAMRDAAVVEGEIEKGEQDGDTETSDS